MGDMAANSPAAGIGGLDVLNPRRRILLIEDNRDVVDVLTMILEPQGYALTVSHSPAEALPLLRAVAFDLVMTDGFSRLPQDVLANTAAVLTAAGATPVALFTGHRIERDAAQAAGFCDLIPKPFDLETLERQVRTLLNPGTLPLSRSSPLAPAVAAAELELTHG
jgi:DNA-binding NtrC family response regulator